MKLLKDIFARIWAFWGIVTFLVTFLLIFLPSMVCYLIPDPRGAVIFRNLSKLWMDVWLFLVGCPVKVKGQQHFKKGQAYIVTCNHNALLDVPLSSPYIPGPNKTIAKTSFSKIPLFGWYYSKGSVLVDRNSDASRRSSVIEMKRVLALGIHMCIYPEGTRNRSGEPLKKFYDGAFRLAVDTGKPIVPTLIFGTRKAMPIHKTFYLLPTRLRMHFLEPVHPSGLKADQLKDKVFAIMHDYYKANS